MKIESSRCSDVVVDPDGNGWLGKSTTPDEEEVSDWVARHPSLERILHVGVGNASLRQRFGIRVKQALTKDGAEARHAEKLGLTTLLCNKYDIASYAGDLRAPFDCIVDVNIRSYSCCDVHFREYMDLMRKSLEPKGVLLTNRRGLDYLRPTSTAELRSLCPEWTIRDKGNVVALYPRQHDLRSRIAMFLKSVVPQRG
jgi:hypothetical protein